MKGEGAWECPRAATENLAEEVLEPLENRLLRLAVPFEVVALPEALDGLTLVFGEFFRHVDADMHHQIADARAVALNGGNALVAQAECLARRSCRRWWG